MNKTLQGKVALVTGGASGIGQALATELASRGCDVVLADRQVELATAIAKDIEAKGGGRAWAEALDVREFSQFERVANATLDRSGGIDFLFNNAGIAVGGEMDGYGLADWDDVIDVNLRGVAYGVQAVYPSMVKRRTGHIINTASVAGLVPAAGTGSYCATKHAVVGLTKALRVEARVHGVRASVMCPGAIKTPILTGGTFGRFNYRNITARDVLAMWDEARPMAPEVFARKALDAVLRDEAYIIVPGWWKAFWYLDRVSPSLSLRVWGSRLEKMRAQLARLGATAARPGDAAQEEHRKVDEPPASGESVRPGAPLAT